jgi:hypothetical protein
MKRAGCWLVLLLALAAVRRAHAADAPPSIPARFAIIVGVNTSVTNDPPLRYADDDAAGYLELFRALGARTYLLSRFDEGTRRLHQQAAAEARDPRRADLAQMVEQVAADVALARGRGLPTVVYFVYAGHGNVDNGRGYLALEDARLYGADLEKLIVDRIGAAQTHFIIDACYSVFLALSRGPGGERHEAHGFSALGGLGARPGVGLLLSTSSARESHEWSEFQGGVFSHEVRSGLLGAADANGDGQISYREIAAFVERANAPIPNEKFRPDVYAKEPASAPPLMDLRPGLGRRLELDGDHPGHYFIEDARGVRLADFNNAPGHALRMIRPAVGELFLRKLAPTPDGEVEYVMEAAPAVLRLEDLLPRPSTAQARGAAHESFRLLFSLAFSQQVVDTFVVRGPDVAEVPEERPARSLRRPIGWGLIAVGTVAAAGATWVAISALDARPSPRANQMEIYQANQVIADRNDRARLLYGVSGIALTAGVLVLLWPRFAHTEPPVAVGLVPRAEGGAVLGWSGRF